MGYLQSRGDTVAGEMSLITSYNSAVSGLMAASAQMNVATGNVANLFSQNYQAQRVNLTNTQAGGVAVASITTDTTPGDVDGDGDTESNVDPANEMVQMMLARFAYIADAHLLRIDNDTVGTLLDMFR
jgi:flagellar basal body rod protein FlgC